VARFGQTKTAARNALKAALAERVAAAGTGITRETKVSELAKAWLAEIDASDRPAQTREMYRYRVDSYVVPQIGALRLREATTSTIDAALSTIRDTHGPGAAKTAKSILNGMFSLAVRHDAIPTNPVRETSRIPRGRKLARALSDVEQDALTDALRADEQAVLWDLPDLVEFMLGTGVRIGEACAVRDSVIDLDAAACEINATTVRLKGQGVTLQERPKTDASHRVLTLPGYVVAMIQRRQQEPSLERPYGVIFPSPRGELRDRSNTAGDLRTVLDRLGYKWVTSHTFRKTVATRLDQAGLSGRKIADQLGHARPSITADVYMGRKQGGTEAAEALDR
jgi:integrase